MQNFDPNKAALDGAGIFGLPFTEKESKLIFIPVPWEATTSYGGGTSDGPKAILEASRQQDLFDLEISRPYEAGMCMLKESAQIRKWNSVAKKEAAKIIKVGGEIGKNKVLKKALETVNDISTKVNKAVYKETMRVLNAGKIAAIVGGDHASPLGAFQAVGEKFGDFGILHLDAHSDTRDAYEGFQYSHASIMRNAINEIPRLKKLVQVGIRDFCEEEFEFVRSKPDRISVHYDSAIQKAKFSGESWDGICKRILKNLPDRVWISFDIDGLDPRFCPHTGTPVPGGLDFQEAVHLIRELALSGRKIIGFDLNEVAPGPDGDEWDANVGMRMLYKMSMWTLNSQKLCKLMS